MKKQTKVRQITNGDMELINNVEMNLRIVRDGKNISNNFMKLHKSLLKECEKKELMSYVITC